MAKQWKQFIVISWLPQQKYTIPLPPSPSSKLNQSWTFHHLCDLGVWKRWKYGRLQREVRSTPCHIETDLRAALRYQYWHLAVFLCGTVERRIELLALQLTIFFPFWRQATNPWEVIELCQLLCHFLYYEISFRTRLKEKLCFSSSNSALVRGQPPGKPKALDCSPVGILCHCQLFQWTSGNVDLFWKHHFLELSPIQF